MAGLLTYSGYRGLPNRHNQWLSCVLGTFTGAYSSGTVRDFHPIPFSFYTPDGVSKPMRGKGNTIYQYRSIFCSKIFQTKQTAESLLKKIRVREEIMDINLY